MCFSILSLAKYTYKMDIYRPVSSNCTLCETSRTALFDCWQIKIDKEPLNNKNCNERWKNIVSRRSYLSNNNWKSRKAVNNLSVNACSTGKMLILRLINSIKKPDT